jgi:hypothetical protein
VEENININPLEERNLGRMSRPIIFSRHTRRG